MDVASTTAKIKELVEKANDILIVTHEHPTADSVGSALAAYLGLTAMGKRVTVACPDPVTVALSSFVGVNKITTDLGKKNFVISLDYVDGSIEKVSYNIEGNKFHLVIEPRPTHEFDESKVHYARQGITADLIFVVDTVHLGGLKDLYERQKDLFATKSIINVDRHPNNSNFGQINIVDSRASSTAELVAQLLSGIGVQLTVDIANNLLNGLYGATNNFTLPSVSASAFEVAAVCARAGAFRFASAPVSEEVPSGESVGRGTRPSEATPLQPTPQMPIVPSTSVGMLQGLPKASPGVSTGAPEDWLKPKIFKSTSIS